MIILAVLYMTKYQMKKINKKKYENEINKRTGKKLNNINIEIKNEIANKYLKPSLNQIEIKMKRNLEEKIYLLVQINKYYEGKSNIF